MSGNARLPSGKTRNASQEKSRSGACRCGMIEASEPREAAGGAYSYAAVGGCDIGFKRMTAT